MTSLAGGLEQALLGRLASSTGRAVDLAYAALVHQLGITPRFFPQGFGELEVINFHEDVDLFSAWPPPHFEEQRLAWRRVGEGTAGPRGGAAYDVFKASFRTPVTGRAYDALPEESRTACALWIAPRAPAPGAPTVLHLAATGDHGFARRQHLGLPLVAQGIGTLALESPYYGTRRPAGQRGAKLRRVSDLLLLGRTTIEESLLLLQWLGWQGHVRLGVSGLSMGGVHASMVAALYPAPLALTPLLAPRSAARAYCTGALYYATAWDRLVKDTEARQPEIAATVEAAGRPNARVAAARVRARAQDTAAAAAAAAECVMAEEQAAAILPGTPALTGAPQRQPAEHTQQSQQPLGAQAAAWRAAGSWLQSQAAAGGALITRVRRLEHTDGHAAAVALLEAVLEAYTDVTRFPLPQRPDAAVLVAASEDAYVCRQSVEELHRHLPGSEVRWVSGGHVSSFLLHQATFRAAIADSLARL